MSSAQGHHVQGDTAPVHREEIATFVPQALLSLLGLGAADPEALDLQGAEVVDLRATPELFTGPGDLKWNDGRLVVQWNMNVWAVVTTPNTLWMPEFPAATPGQIAMHADGRWVPQEYLLWPQLFSHEVSHHACIPTQEANITRVRVVEELYKHMEELYEHVEELYEHINERMWHPNEACGVPDLGFLDIEPRTRLFDGVDKCFNRWKSASAGARSGERGWGDVGGAHGMRAERGYKRGWKGQQN